MSAQERRKIILSFHSKDDVANRVWEGHLGCIDFSSTDCIINFLFLFLYICIVSPFYYLCLLGKSPLIIPDFRYQYIEKHYKVWYNSH